MLKASGKPKSINKEYLMHDLSPEKSKRTEWGFLKATTILNTLLVYSD